MSAPREATPPSKQEWLANRIRRSIARGRGDSENDELPAGWSAPPAIRAADVEELTASWDVRFVITGSGASRLGPLVTQVRKFFQAALFPFLVRLSEFNAASVRVLAALAEHASEADARNASLEERIDLLEQAAALPVAAPVEDDAETEALRERIADAAASAHGTVVVAGEAAEIADLLRAAGRNVLVAEDAAAAVNQAGGGIGAVVLAGALERLVPAKGARLLEILADGLAPGGVLAVEAVNPRSARALLALSSVGGLHPYDPDALEELLRQLGYVEVRTDLPTPRAGRYAIVARRRPIS